MNRPPYRPSTTTYDPAPEQQPMRPAAPITLAPKRVQEANRRQEDRDIRASMRQTHGVSL
ncbi:MAG: hypothetical protein M3141_10645 [Actinomycetota bacterium]|nr:hypothetical protein [Actinomycetota bacterium]